MRSGHTNPSADSPSRSVAPRLVRLLRAALAASSFGIKKGGYRRVRCRTSATPASATTASAPKGRAACVVVGSGVWTVVHRGRGRGRRRVRGQVRRRGRDRRDRGRREGRDLVVAVIRRGRRRRGLRHDAGVLVRVAVAGAQGGRDGRHVLDRGHGLDGADRHHGLVGDRRVAGHGREGRDRRGHRARGEGAVLGRGRGRDVREPGEVTVPVPDVVDRDGQGRGPLAEGREGDVGEGYFPWG